VAGPLPIGEKWPENHLLQAQRSATDSFHVYVHIPFCTVRCGYCDFNTYTQQEMPGVAMADFHLALVKEIEFSKSVLEMSNLRQPSISSVFFGGGTPSLFTWQQIKQILDALSSNFGFTENCEITMEANPESTNTDLLEGVRAAGVNRLSIGVQSYDAAVLKVLDRQHDATTIDSVLKLAKDLDFQTSIDLIYGAPGESLKSWQETLTRALALQTNHISTYSLIVEEGTKLARQIKSGDLPMVNEDLNADKYEWATERIESTGLAWYEVSNFGNIAQHNLAYWDSRNWWGYGPGAHSHIAGNRFWNQKHPARYQQSLAVGSPVAGIERLSDRQQLEESLMLGLRTKFGVPRELLSQLGVDSVQVAQQLAIGTLTMQEERIVVTKRGRLLVDRLVVDFLQ
jgi:oxygen-independent coproporphyrinogen-3 oxidase